MKRTFLIAAVLCVLSAPAAVAQTATPPQEQPQPGITLPDIDWTSKTTWLKLAFLVGSVVLAKRAFRQMKG